MKYKVIEKENQIISLEFEDVISIDAEIYSIISRNTAILIPGMRDLSAVNTINYDVLGSVPLAEHLRNTVYDKEGMYNFLLGIMDVIQSIGSLGIKESQIVYDLNHTYVSMYDKSVRFICLPVHIDSIESIEKPADMFKKIALTAKSSGAYELLGYIIEQTTSEDFSVSEFKKGFVRSFDEKRKVATEQKPKSNISSEALTSGLISNLSSNIYPGSFMLENQNRPVAENSFSEREYIPAGIPVAFSGNESGSSNTIDPDNKTQVLFAGAQEIGDIPFLSPVDNNSPEARIYIAGEKLTIGRHSENDLQINVSTVSGKHAEIHRSGSVCTITDLHSTNKTYVNGAVLASDTPVKLKHQDLVAFNKVRYRYFDH